MIEKGTLYAGGMRRIPLAAAFDHFERLIAIPFFSITLQVGVDPPAVINMFEADCFLFIEWILSRGSEREGCLSGEGLTRKERHRQQLVG